jgi:hypothetical protein
VLPAGELDEVGGEEGDVALALPQRGYVDDETRQAAVEVPETTLPDRLFEVLVRRRQDPHVHRDLPRVPQPPDLPVLEDAEEAALQPGLHVPDLVQQQRTAVGRLEEPGLRRTGVV